MRRGDGALLGAGLRLGNVRGHFFCARIDSELRLRFVPMDAARPIERDSLGCLARITGVPESPRQPPEVANHIRRHRPSEMT